MTIQIQLSDADVKVIRRWIKGDTEADYYSLEDLIVNQDVFMVPDIIGAIP